MKKKHLAILGILSLVFINCMSQAEIIQKDKYLMVVDVQQFDFKSSQLQSSVGEMVENINALLGNFEPVNIIYIKAGGKVLNISLKGISMDTLAPREFDSNLKILGDNIFVKVEGDAFTSPELMEFLRARHAQEIIIVGLLAEKCVYDTALGGKYKGMDISVVPECIVGTTPKKKEKAILKMNEKGVRSIPMKKLLF